MSEYYLLIFYKNGSRGFHCGGTKDGCIAFREHGIHKENVENTIIVKENE